MAIVLGLAVILLWPMRMLLRHRRKAVRPVEVGGAADLVGTSANPSNPDSGAWRDRESVLVLSYLCAAAVVIGPCAAAQGRTIVLGFDGMDAALIERGMADANLSDFARLAREGHYQPLVTTNPPQSPMAWASFANGLNPGDHGTFDSLRRNSETYAPEYSISFVEQPDAVIRAFGYQLPLRAGTTRSRRVGTPFWISAEREGHPSSVLRVPTTYPADPISRMLSGMGVPDLLGTQGTLPVLIRASLGLTGTADRTQIAASRGVFDLASPAFAGIDSLMSGWLPDLGRLTVWGLLAAFVSMGLYRLTSNQARLASNKEEIAALQHRLREFDGPMSELWPLLGRNFALAGRRLLLTLVPALIASVPVVFILAWVSNAFDAELPEVGETVLVEAIPSEGHQLPPLRWQDDGGVRENGTGVWSVAWPAAAEPVELVDSDGTVLLALPTEAPVSVVHQRRWWNALIGNPAGYLPSPGDVDAIELAMPRPEFLPFGPDWLRGWMAYFFGVVLVLSLLLKFLWRLH